MKNPRILISGAGIAGPCLAWWLLRHGFAPTLVERAPELRTGGYILDFWGLGFDVAEKMGLIPALADESYEIDAVRIVGEHGEKTGGFSTCGVHAAVGDRWLNILRSDLARRIYQALDGRVETIFGDSVAAIAEDDGGVQVSFRHAAPAHFDLVIGAGGLHSPVRALVFGPEDRYEDFLGYYVASFGVDDYPRRDPHTFVTYAAPGRQLSRYSLRGDRTVFLFVFANDKRLPFGPHNLDAQKDTLKAAFGRDGWECRDILAAMDRSGEVFFDPVSQIHMPSWTKGRVALIGDACSCPSLLAGQGSALAMVAAYILAGELAKADGDHRAAFRAYEAMLQPVLAKKQKAARRFATSFAPKTKLGIYLRNELTRLMTQPFMARLFMGRLLADSFPLPAYPSP